MEDAAPLPSPAVEAERDGDGEEIEPPEVPVVKRMAFRFVKPVKLEF